MVEPYARAAVGLLACVCVLLSAGAQAQSLRANGAEFSRDQRLLRDLRVEPVPAATPAPTAAKALVASEPAAAKVEVLCGVGLHHEWAGHAPDAIYTPAFCELPVGRWTLGIDTDGYVRESGEGGVRGLADINLGAAYKLISKDVGLAFGVGVTLPTHTDAGSTKSSQSGQLTLAIAPWGKAQPSVTYEVVRNGEPESAGGRSTQRLGATLRYPWQGGAMSRLDVGHRKPSRAAGVSSLALTHTMDLISSLGLKASGTAVRTRAGWTNTLTLLVEQEF